MARTGSKQAELPASGEWTPRLVEDEPIEGTVTDTGGTPLAGVKIRLQHDPSDHGRLARRLSQLGARQSLSLLPAQPAGHAGSGRRRPACRRNAPQIKQGRFHIAGVGRERLVTLEVAGPNIERLTFYTLTRRDADLKALKNLSPQNRMMHEAGANLPLIYSSRFHHVAGPSRPIVGTVRDGQTQRRSRTWA